MAISKPILEQTLDEYRKQMSVNGVYFQTFRSLLELYTDNILQWTELSPAQNMQAKYSNVKVLET